MPVLGEESSWWGHGAGGKKQISVVFCNLIGCCLEEICCLEQSSIGLLGKHIMLAESLLCEEAKSINYIPVLLLCLPSHISTFQCPQCNRVFM